MDFEGKVKEYLNKFPLKTSNSLWLYNIIGKKELELINEYKQKYKAENNIPQPQRNQNLDLNLNFNQPKPEKPKGKGMKKKKGPQNEQNNIIFNNDMKKNGHNDNNQNMNINMNQDMINNNYIKNE